LIKSQYAFATYDASMGWIGNLTSMQPGEGYMYKSTDAVSGTLTYPTAGLSKTDIAEPKTIRVDGWNLVPENYQFTMSVIGKVYGSDTPISENMIIGAFVGNECRGVAQPVFVNGEWLYFITLYSNIPNENVRFELRNIQTNQSVSIAEQLSFQANNLIGDAANPQPLSVNTPTQIEQISDAAFTVFPNPTKGLVTLSSNTVSGLDNARLELTDVTGKVIFQQKSIATKTVELDLSELAAGVYFVKISTINQIFTEKIIVK